LATDQAAEVENNTLGLITLAEKGSVGVLKARQLLLVPLSLTFKLFSNFLLKDQSLESIITLLLSSRQANSETCGVILLLVDETSKTPVLSLVVLNLDLEILGLFRELFGESLEFEELGILVLED
jgi:hypothetical protein